uniref:Uncharacterized protein n=1 Tax=Skeletonema marinoi TaxID=267567 RepID=A0A7S2KK08_9STRA|mmetsp:Transcript_13519/g.22727  ORF Transcript_13519/g.22727 Transcript_13519/m.22727 type:complete len:315 (+) Transcript_13519:33-977(+)
MISLSDLPTGALAHVSSYLASPLSCALFAAALNHRDVDSSTAITGSQWDALDFGHIEKELAAKLTDDDISALLTYIDAVNNIKKLRLTNCINITGVGLKPLRGSIMIQQIDLSLVGDHESPVLYPEPSLSCTKVLPILDSIIERGEECALKHVQFPKVWRFYERNVDSDFHAFLARYNGMLGNRDRDRVICLKCSRDLPANEIMRMDVAQRQWYGIQRLTCCNCMDCYCEECRTHDGNFFMNDLCQGVKGFTALIAFRRDFAIAVNVGIVRTAWILNNALIVKRRFASAASPKEDAAVPIKSGVITVLIIMMMC